MEGRVAWQREVGGGGGLITHFHLLKDWRGGLLEREGKCSTGLSVYCIILLIIVLSLWYLLE